MISWDGILIMMFAAIVPTSPQRMAVAGLLAVSMNPLGMLVARAEGIWQFDSVFAVFDMHFPDYLLVGGGGGHFACGDAAGSAGGQSSRAGQLPVD